MQKYKIFERAGKKREIKVGETTFGSNQIVLIAGPCAVENRNQITQIAKVVKLAGADILRGGAYKPRTDPYSFQGHGIVGLKMLQEAKKITGLPIVTEVLETRDVETVCQYADMLQIGARNMHNFALLKEVGKANIPILLKRGFAATVKEFLLAAEYILDSGNQNIVLCERGIRTFSTDLRFTPDFGVIPVIQKQTHLPIIFDPSHSAGRRDLILPLSKAAIAVGSDGLIIETHHKPDQALSDADQAVILAEFPKLVKELQPVAKAIGRAI